MLKHLSGASKGTTALNIGELMQLLFLSITVNEGACKN